MLLMISQTWTAQKGSGGMPAPEADFRQAENVGSVTDVF